jgi:hypothetical protein
LHAINGGPLVLWACQNLVFRIRVRETAYLENVQTDRATSQVNVRVVAWSIKFYRWCGIRVVWREGNRNLEAQASVNLAEGGQWKGSTRLELVLQWPKRLQSFRPTRRDWHRILGRQTSRDASTRTQLDVKVAAHDSRGRGHL